MSSHASDQRAQYRAVLAPAFAFGICFGVWIIFLLIGIGINKELDLAETGLALLVGQAVLGGSLIRLTLTIRTDRYAQQALFDRYAGGCAYAR